MAKGGPKASGSKSRRNAQRKNAVDEVDVDSLINEEVISFETGILPLDCVLGGGVGRGDIIEVYADTGVGKSTGMAALCRNMASVGEQCYYLDFERGLKDSSIKSFGLWEYYSPKNPKPHEDLFVKFVPRNYTHYEAILKKYVFVECSTVKHLVIDSFTNIAPVGMDDFVIGTVNPGMKAQQDSQFFAKYTGMFRDYGITVWYINQMRNKLSMTGNTQYNSQGGNALKFNSDIRLFMFEYGAAKDHEIVSQMNTANGVEDVVVGRYNYIKAIKNRGNLPNIPVSIPVIFGKGISNVKFVTNILISQGFLTLKGSWYSMILANGEEVKGNGLVATEQLVREHYDYCLGICKENRWLDLVKE